MHLLAAFSIYQHPIYFKVFTARQQFQGNSLTISQHTKRLPGFRTAFQIRHLQSLVNVKFPLFAVFSRAVIIIQPISQIRILLDLCHQRTSSNCMDRTRLNKKQIILSDRNLLQIIHKCPICNSLSHLPFGAVTLQTIHQLCISAGIQHIPHFRFSQLSLLVLPCILIRRMHLNGEIPFCINKFNQNRKLRHSSVTLSQILWVISQHLCQLHASKLTADHITRTVRVRRTFPGLCHG